MSGINWPGIPAKLGLIIAFGIQSVEQLNKELT